MNTEQIKATMDAAKKKKAQRKANADRNNGKFDIPESGSYVTKRYYNPEIGQWMTKKEWVPYEEVAGDAIVAPVGNSEAERLKLKQDYRQQQKKRLDDRVRSIKDKDFHVGPDEEVDYEEPFIPKVRQDPDTDRQVASDGGYGVSDALPRRVRDGIKNGGMPKIYKYDSNEGMDKVLSDWVNSLEGYDDIARREYDQDMYNEYLGQKYDGMETEFTPWGAHKPVNYNESDLERDKRLAGNNEDFVRSGMKPANVYRFDSQAGLDDIIGDHINDHEATGWDYLRKDADTWAAKGFSGWPTKVYDNAYKSLNESDEERERRLYDDNERWLDSMNERIKFNSRNIEDNQADKKHGPTINGIPIDNDEKPKIIAEPVTEKKPNKTPSPTGVKEKMGTPQMNTVPHTGNIYDIELGPQFTEIPQGLSDDEFYGWLNGQLQKQQSEEDLETEIGTSRGGYDISPELAKAFKNFRMAQIDPRTMYGAVGMSMLPFMKPRY